MKTSAYFWLVPALALGASSALFACAKDPLSLGEDGTADGGEPSGVETSSSGGEAGESSTGDGSAGIGDGSAGTGDGSAGTGGGSAGTGGGSAGTGGGSAGTGGGGNGVTSLFRTNFNDLNAAATNLYDFENRYAQSATTWQTTHTTDQGWLGSPAPHLTIHGCTAGAALCNTSEHQFNAGWVTPALNFTPTIGDRLFVRFRIKFDPGTQFPIEKFGSKFILVGTTGTTPNSRWIIHLMPALENNGCTLGFDYSYMSPAWVPPASIWYTYLDWGFSANFDQQPIAQRYASFQSNVNIGWSCNPGVLVTASDHPAPVPKPQFVGNAATDGWNHLQFEAVSGADGTAAFRTWANSNAHSNPSSERLDMPEGLGVAGWESGVNVGGYWGTSDMADMGFIIDDFEIGTTFDPSWAP